MHACMHAWLSMAVQVCDDPLCRNPTHNPFLNGKEWISILHLVLHNDYNSFKSNFMFLESMFEGLFHNCKIFQSTVKCLMPQTCMTFEFVKLRFINFIWISMSFLMRSVIRIKSLINHDDFLFFHQKFLQPTINHHLCI